MIGCVIILYLVQGKSSNTNIPRSQVRSGNVASQRSQRVVEECELPHLALPERAKKRKSKTRHSTDLRLVFQINLPYLVK